MPHAALILQKSLLFALEVIGGIQSITRPSHLESRETARAQPESDI